MTPWKAALGLGAVCAACCAVPLLGGVATLALGTASLAALASVLLAWEDTLTPLAWAMLAIAAVGAGVALWRRKRQHRNHCVPGECR
jgi:UDP-N-acetylmuramyl pentapeptide phosphotransferase/UDP-N-acetylglucosamine-1-phosphate transferase